MAPSTGTAPGTQSMAGVFISYRRDDCAGHAGRLYDRLADRLGESSVFMDVDAIELGADFGVRIDEAIGACRLVIVLIGDDWLDIADGRGRRRLDDPTDFVRREVATALRRSDVRVIPVLVEGATMPPVERLPEDLKSLARRNALELSDAGWRYDVERLIEAVERVVSPAPATSTQQAAPVKRPSSAWHGGEEHASSGGHGHASGTTDASVKDGRGGGSVVRSPWALAGGALVLMAGILGAVLLTGGDDTIHAPSISGTAETPPQHADTNVDRTVLLESHRNGITFANRSVWVLSARSPDIAVLDAKTGSRLRPIPIQLGATAVAAGFNSVWLVKGNTRSLIRFNRAGDRRGSTHIQGAGRPVAVAAGARAVWVGVRNGHDGTLVRVDRSDLTRQKSIQIPGGVQDIAVGKGAVWVTTISGNHVVRVDANNMANIKEIPVGEQPKGVAVGQGAIWVANAGTNSSSITPINPRTRRAGREIDLEFSPTRVATGGGSVWVTATGANRLIRIDPRRRKVREEIPTGSQPYALDVIGDHAVWVTLLKGHGVQRVSFDP